MKNGSFTSLLVLLSLLFNSGCMEKERPAPPLFNKIYQQMGDDHVEPFLTPQQKNTITLSAKNTPLLVVLRQISTHFHVSIIASSTLEKSFVNYEAEDATLDDSLSAIARSLSSRLTKIGKIYFIGQQEPEDRGILVRKVARLSAEELGKFLELFKSEVGRTYAYSDGVVVASDRVEVLARMTQAIDQLESAPSGSWVIQLYLITLSDVSKVQLGLDLSLQAKFTSSYNSSTGRDSDKTAILSGVIKSVSSFSGNKYINSPLLVIRDGSEGKIKNSTEIRIPKKQTSPYGTVEVIGYESVDSGLDISARIRSDTREAAFLDLDVALGQIVAIDSNGIPTIARQQLKTQSSVESGGVYLLGQLEGRSNSAGIGGNVLPSVFDSASDNSSLLIWAQVYRIKAPVTLEGAAVAADGERVTGSRRARAAGHGSRDPLP